MKLAEIIKEKFKPKAGTEGAELSDLLDTIIKIEQRRDQAKAELENARRHLQNEQARSVDEDSDADIDSAVQGVVSETAKLDSLESLLREAKNKGTALIAAGSATQRQRLTEVEAEVAETRSAIDVRRVRNIATFAKTHGLRISWPTRHQGGAIHLPALSIDGGELERIADATVTSVFRDEDQDQLDALLAERQRLNLLIQSQPDLGLESLLAERRRK